MPHTEQVAAFVSALNAAGFDGVITLEAIVRGMLVRKDGTRLPTKGVWHTGYLVFARKRAPRMT